MGLPRVTMTWDPSPKKFLDAFDGIDLGREFATDLFRARYPADIAEMIRARVRERGLARSGAPLRPYRPGTVAARLRAGLPSRPDLTVSGVLLDSLIGRKSFANDKEFVVVFAGAHPGGMTNVRLADWLEKGTKKMRPWKFFGLTPADKVMAFAVALALFQRVTIVRVQRMISDGLR